MAILTSSADHRGKQIRAVEKRFGEPIELVLRRLYYEEKLTQAEVAKKLRVPAGTVGGWMVRFGINQRTLAAQAAKELTA